jgi:hypothetical protein
MVGMCFYAAPVVGGPADNPQTQEASSSESEDQQAAQRVEDEMERKEKQESRKDIVVYSCFGLSLILLLWMRKRSKSGNKE